MTTSSRLIDTNESATAVTTWVARKATARSDRFLCIPSTTSRELYRPDQRIATATPETMAAVRSTMLTAPEPRIRYQIQDGDSARTLMPPAPEPATRRRGGRGRHHARGGPAGRGRR